MCLFGGYCGVCVLVLSEARDKPPGQDKHGFNPIAIIITVVVPFLVSIGFLAQRYIRELNFFTSGAWIAGASIPIFSIQIARRDVGFVSEEMNVIDYFIVSAIAIFGAMQLIF